MPLGWLAKTAISAGINGATSLAVDAITRPDTSRAEASVPPTRHYHYNHYYHYNVNIKSQDGKDLRSCLSFFAEGMKMFLTCLNRVSCESLSDQCTALTTDVETTGIAHEIDILEALGGRDVFTAEVDKLKSISMESFAWAKSSFRAAREDATRAFNDKELVINARVLAAKVRILSAIFGCLDEPATAAVACKMYLNELNAMPFVSKEINKVDGLSNQNKSQLLILVAFLNYYVFLFAEKLAGNVLNVYNWPRLRISDVLFLHPTLSVGLRALTIGPEDRRYDTDPKSVSFSDSIDATDLALNSAGKLVVVGLNGTGNTVVHVYSDSGEFEFAISPTDEELDGVEFQPCAVFTDKNDDIYVQTKARGPSSNDKAALFEMLFVFDKEGHFQRILSIQDGFMALEKKSGKIFISNKNGVLVYENSGEFVRRFESPEALRGCCSPIALCAENTIIQTDIHDQNIYLLNDTKVRKLVEVEQARGRKYIAFNPASGELVVLYLSKDLTSFQLDVYLPNERLLATMKLPEYSSHPRALTVTPSGRIAVLYKDIVHFI